MEAYLLLIKKYRNKYNMKYFNEITLKQFFDMGNQYQLIINITEDCNLR